MTTRSKILFLKICKWISIALSAIALAIAVALFVIAAMDFDSPEFEIVATYLGAGAALAISIAMAVLASNFSQTIASYTLLDRLGQVTDIQQWIRKQSERNGEEL